MKAGILKWFLAVGMSLGILSGHAAELEEAPMVSGLIDLKQLDQKLIRMSERCSLATVALVAKSGGGTGSGVVVSETGLILTAAHVVEAMKGGVVVIFPDGTRKNGEVLGGEFDRDAAMVQITEEGEYPFVELAEDELVQRNQWCVALGHPGGFDPNRTPPIRLGRVVAQRDFIETDCAVVGGDSGGPLFDVEGRLIGIHSNIGASLSQNRHVPLDVFRAHWDAMKEGKRTGSRFAEAAQREIDLDRPVIGVQLGEPGPRGGVRVVRVIDGSPAAKAGLNVGDIIKVFGGQKVNSSEALIRAAGRFAVGKKMRVVYLRDGKRKRTELKLVRMGDLMGKRAAEESGSDEQAPKSKLKNRSALKLDELLKKSMENGGRLELTPELLEELGGREELTKNLRELMKKMDPEVLRELAKREGSLETQDPFFASVVDALIPIVREAGSSTVSILADGKRVSLGAVVSEGGLILTKNEETKDGELAVRVGEESFTARVVERFARRDLALLAIDTDDLTPVRWANSDEELRLGSLLTAPSPEGEAMGIGLVSVRERAFGDVGFLGVRTEQNHQGVLVASVIAKSSAAMSGLSKGDVIIELEGESVTDPIEFGNRVRGLRAGDEIEFRFLRDGDEKELTVKLGARPPSVSDRFRRMNEMAGALSAKVSGYPEALQHDMPLRPEQCGGPLLDLRGLCVGINVSRAGRVKTLAIPAEDVLKLLEEVELDDETLNAEDLDAVRDLIEEVQHKLSELQARLKALEAR